MRTSLGAGRGRLVRQLLTESLLLTAVAGVAGAAAGVGARCGARSGWARGRSRVWSRWRLDGRVLLACAAVALGTAFLFGLYPALRLTRSGLSRTLRSGGRGGSGRRGRAWDALIAGEVALAVVLLVGAGLLVRSLGSIVALDAGWGPEGVLQMTVTPPGGVFESRGGGGRLPAPRGRRDRRAAGGDAVGMGTFGPLDAGTYTAPARDPVRDRVIDGFAGWRLVDAGYFGRLGVPPPPGAGSSSRETRASPW